MSAIRRLDIDKTTCRPTHDNYEIFRENAEQIGAEVHRVLNHGEALDKIKQILTELNVTKAAAVPSPLVNRLMLENLSSYGVVYQNLETEAFLAEVGISSAEMAVAETGSLVQIGSSMDERRVSKLSEINIVLVKTESLVLSFNEAMEKIYLEYEAVPGYFSFISGPSRTSDIERVLTIGVHGPRRLIIIFTDELSGGK